MNGTRTILLVDPDVDRRYGLGSALEHAGYDVTLCPGPGRPDYTCLGSHSDDCPLIDDADAVVLDIRAGDALGMTGTSPHELLGLYRSHDRPVVVLAGARGDLGPLPDLSVRMVTRAEPPVAVVGALRSLLRSAGDRSRRGGG
jgi:CheY-like chemotaxis protein